MHELYCMETICSPFARSENLVAEHGRVSFSDQQWQNHVNGSTGPSRGRSREGGRFLCMREIKTGSWRPLTKSNTKHTTFLLQRVMLLGYFLKCMYNYNKQETHIFHINCYPVSSYCSRLRTSLNGILKESIFSAKRKLTTLWLWAQREELPKDESWRTLCICTSKYGRSWCSTWQYMYCCSMNSHLFFWMKHVFLS